MTREKELAREGWQKQFTLDEPRLSDAIEAYEEIGLEVHLEPFDPFAATQCSECMRSAPEAYKTIYTRGAVGR